MTKHSQTDFTKGLILSIFSLGMVAMLLHLILYKAGEVNLNHIIEKQLENQIVLFSSGINQNTYIYKTELLKKLTPEIVVIGSSRAMQFRKEFFQRSFLNLGGSVSNVADLEQLAVEINNSKSHPELLILTIDPWWFNPHYLPAHKPHISSEFPELINIDLVVNAAKALDKGNWINTEWKTSNLGLHAILTGEGFSSDGSYHYVGTVTADKLSKDEMFAGTLARIANSNQRFEKSDRVEATLVNKACNAINKLKRSSSNVILIAPPFAQKVWDKLNEGGYEYILEGYNKLEACTGLKINNYVNPYHLNSSSDCEFIDGFHGGDTVSARMLLHVSKSESNSLISYIKLPFLEQFVLKFTGHAGGVTTMNNTGKKEVDFLKLGCSKQLLY